MSEYIPKHIPEMTIEYTTLPGFPPEVWIQNIKIYGDYVSEYLALTLIDQHRAEWVREIRETQSCYM